MSLPSNIHNDEPSVPRNQEQPLVSITGHEANIDSTRASDEQVVELKRTRNSLSNISARLPPEILGCIFVWNIARERSRSLDSFHFRGLRKGSYNFLLVCHHWFEVASRTPELWSFWGTTLQDWKKRHHRSGGTPLDLVLDGYRDNLGARFDGSLHSAVERRVVQGTIRQVHLRSNDIEIITSIISSLTPGEDEGVRNENIESIVWHNVGTHLAGVSDFFARSRLSKLYLLDLCGGFQIRSWNHLASQTTLLTALSLRLNESSRSPTPTTSQLFSILASNPNLRQLVLSGGSLPNDADRSALEVPLPNLNLLSLKGGFHRILGLLRGLLLPAMLDTMELTLFNPTVDDVSRTLGPYMRDYFRRDVRFAQDRLIVSCSFASFFEISVDTTGDLPATQMVPEGSVTITVIGPPPHGLWRLVINLIAPIPRENVVFFVTDSIEEFPEEVFSMMPNIEILRLSNMELFEGFLQPNVNGPRANTKLLPSLKSLYLEDVTLEDDNWGHLTKYLVHQTSDNQTITLAVTDDCPYLPPRVAKEIKDLVEKFTIIAADSSDE